MINRGVVSRIAILWAVLALGAVCPAGAEEPAKSVTAEQALQFLKDGNARFVAGRLQSKDLGADRRALLSKGQHPFAVVLACADSRVVPELLFDQGLGDIFVLRVAGNVSDPFVLGSIEYAVEHFHVPLVVVLGHQKCGAVAAALSSAKPDGNLGKLVAQIHVGEHLPDDNEQALAQAVTNNARYQGRLLTQRSAVIREHVDQKKVRIATGVYGLDSGKVQWLDE